MSDTDKKTSQSIQRKDRLKQALKANLQRRKTQAKARAEEKLAPGPQKDGQKDNG